MDLLTESQSNEIEQAVSRLRNVLGVTKSSVSVRLVVRKARVVGVCFSLCLGRPAGISCVDWLDELAARVASIGNGYGEAEAILNEKGEVEGGRITVSLDLKSLGGE